ncbi:hypothetical protein JXI42_04535 [bacterium]|nr:hypothetical protein [bacterium]
MKNHKNVLLYLFICSSLSFIILQSSILVRYSILSAAVPRMITYQGKVTDTLGVGLNDTVDITFTLYNSATEGTNLWQELHNDVVVSKGLFDVILGSITPINLAFDVDYWLEIDVGGDILLPRTRLTSSPYSFRAGIADSLKGGIGPIPDNHAQSVIWPEYPNSVFWRGTTTENKAIRAVSSYDNTTGKNYYAITKQAGTGVQNYHIVTIWHPPADYNYANNDSTQFTLHFVLSGDSPAIDQVRLSRANGTSTNLIGDAALTDETATLEGFTGLTDSEWVTIDISTSVNDGEEIRLYHIEIEYLK